MSENKPRRKLAAILAADVVGFSKMMGKNEDRTLKNLKACRTITDESIVSNHGRIFGSSLDQVRSTRKFFKLKLLRTAIHTCFCYFR